MKLDDVIAIALQLRKDHGNIEACVTTAEGIDNLDAVEVIESPKDEMLADHFGPLALFW